MLPQLASKLEDQGLIVISPLLQNDRWGTQQAPHMVTDGVDR